MNTVYEQIRELAQQKEPQTVRFLCDLIRIPSFSAREKEVVERIAEEMHRTGFDTVRVDELGSVIGTLGCGPRAIAFDAHVDTVLEGDRSQWNFDPYRPVVREGKVWGRGSVDQKGGMASMLCAAAVIRELGLNSLFTLYFTGTVMEEDCDGLCWQHLIEVDGLRPELAVITEPTDLNLYRGQRGRMEIRVEARGRSCHGSAPERGDNAIYKAARIALEVEKLNARLASDSCLGKGSITVTEIRSSSPSLCAVPDGSSLHLDRRLTLGEDAESAVAEVRAAAARAGCPEAEVNVLRYEEPAYTGKVYPTEKYYPTWLLPEDAKPLRTAAEAYRSVLGRDPQIGQWTFSTNGVAIAGRHGIPCIGLGPGNEVYAHAANEACPIGQLTEAAAFTPPWWPGCTAGEMNAPFLYRCSDCGREYERSQVTYLCPSCSAGYRPGIPLPGVLSARFDYDFIRRRFRPSEPDWELFSAVEAEFYPPFPVGRTPFFPIDALGRHFGLASLWVKNDGLNPSGSLKDRASFLVVAEAIRRREDLIVTASTGNAAAALAAVCAAAGKKAVIYVPAAAPPAKRLQMKVFGAEVLPVDGTYDDAFALSLEHTRVRGGLNRNTAYHPLTIEGKKTAGLEIFEQNGWRVPDVILVPVGDGVILAGIAKAFADLREAGLTDRVPRLVAVQAASSDAIHRYVHTGVYRDARNPVPCADSISVRTPSNAHGARRAVLESGGTSVTVSEEEIRSAIFLLGRLTGLFAEPAAAAAAAALPALRDSGGIDPQEQIVLLLTGNGLKDTETPLRCLQP